MIEKRSKQSKQKKTEEPRNKKKKKQHHKSTITPTPTITKSLGHTGIKYTMRNRRKEKIAAKRTD